MSTFTLDKRLSFVSVRELSSLSSSSICLEIKAVLVKKRNNREMSVIIMISLERFICADRQYEQMFS